MATASLAKTSGQQAIYYLGFSTKNMTLPGSTPVQTNVDCVSTDILNHINTPLYSRPHMPSMGTRIPSLTFEQLDQETISIIEEDITKVINYDPRVQLKNLQIYALPDQKTILALVTVAYIELNVVDDIAIEVYTQ